MLLLSSTSLQAFKRCRKSFFLQYVLNLKSRETKGVIEFGLGFHEIVENYAKATRDGSESYSPTAGQPTDVAVAYLNEFGLPDRENILAIEEPMWFRLADGILLRMTHDLVYRRANWICGRDYKTFKIKPTIDVDLDFQGRLYSAGLQAAYPDKRVRFEYHNVRQELGRELKGRGYVPWTNEERYQIVDLVCSCAEMERTRREAVAAAREIAALVSDGSEDAKDLWYRTELKGDLPHACGQCFVKEACKMDLQGSLDEQTINLLYDKRDEFDMPDMSKVIDFTRDLTTV